MLLQKINSLPNFKLPEDLLEKALDNIAYYPDDIQLLQYLISFMLFSPLLRLFFLNIYLTNLIFQLFEGCLDFHNMYKLVEERIATVMHGIRSTSKSVREISTAIVHKFAEQSEKNRLLISQCMFPSILAPFSLSSLTPPFLPPSTTD